ncbi:hypothetical protein DFJ58DRAFT_668851, partial [Suillus subalutaceus]|uniref:uncharacterized protein n=1 Tax=Suillus subalutaceus TaxID=48586 RepID=UPI001B872B09
TEGDAFMSSFPITIAAIWWFIAVQLQLLHVRWPREILDSQEAKEVLDEYGNLQNAAFTLNTCELDSTTRHMDYLG